MNVNLINNQGQHWNMKAKLQKIRSPHKDVRKMMVMLAQKVLWVNQWENVQSGYLVI